MASCPELYGNPHLKLLPEFHVAFFISFWNGHIVVFALFLVEQLVPSRTGGEGRVRASEWLFPSASGRAVGEMPLQNPQPEPTVDGGHGQPAPGFPRPPGDRQHAGSHGLPYHPLAGIFISSETPKEREPMKSFRVVRSQSQISTDSRRSLSEGFNLLQRQTHTQYIKTSQTWHLGRQDANSLCLK